MDYYKILNVNQNSTKEDIESSYQEQLSKINRAYNVLSDTESKKQYDEKYKHLSLLDGFKSPFENVITRMHNNFSDSLFPEISNQSQLPPNRNLYQKSYSYTSEYDSEKGVNHVKKVVNDNGKETIQEYDEVVKPKYVDSWGLTRVD
tara:strand:+ start:94 stop:534 length:441 start_codon:yes stop_codon:yes gene_type:complete